MAYTEPTSYKDCAGRLLVLADKLLAISQKHQQLPDHDARRVALTNCRTVTLSPVMVLNVLVMGEEQRISGDDFQKLVGMTTGSVQQAAAILEKTTRLGYVVLFQFQVENLLRNLLRALGGGAPTGYYNVAAELLDRVSVADKAHTLEILNVPALVRNSLHANGIHHGYKGTSTKAMVDGVLFEFTHDSKVSCAGWGHVAHAFKAVVTTVEEILGSAEVLALTAPVEDTYAWVASGQP